MPIFSGVDQRARIVVARAAGALRKRDFDDDLDGLSGTAVFSLRQLFDTGQASLDNSQADMKAIGVRIRDQVGAGPMWPVAVVAVLDQAYVQARQLSSLASADRRLGLFRETAAREGIDTVTRNPPAASQTPRRLTHL